MGRFRLRWIYMYICIYVYMYLCRQEVARIWAKRDAEWERERQARERLMKEVLTERQSQIQHKMDLLKSQQVRTCL